jgi:hypothetical protein
MWSYILGFRTSDLEVRFQVNIIDVHSQEGDQRCGWIRKLIPVSLAPADEHVLLSPQFVF